MQKIKPYLAISYTLVFWGISFISTKICLQAFSVYALIFGRFAIAAIILMLVKRKLEPEQRLLKKDLPRVLIAGLIGFTGYYVFEAVGVDLTGASMASILLSLVPIFCMLIDTIILKQRFTLIKAAAVAFSVVGVVMIVGLSEIQINPWGCGAMILSGLGWLLYNYQAVIPVWISPPISRPVLRGLHCHLPLFSRQISAFLPGRSSSIFCFWQY